MKRIFSLFFALALSLSLLSVTAGAAEDPAFSDSPPTTWYAFAAQDAAERGLMNGVAPGLFQGEGTLTRAMTVTVLWRLAGEPAATEASPFTDVPSGTWYTQAVDWAAQAGAVNGDTPTTFSPDRPVTREELAAIFYRWAQAQDYDITPQLDLPYSDQVPEGQWSYDAMVWATGRLLLVEHPNPAYPFQVMFPWVSPQEPATRGEVAVLLSRFCQAYLDQAVPDVAPVSVQAYGPGYDGRVTVTSPGLGEEAQRVLTFSTSGSIQGGPDRILFHCKAGSELPQQAPLTEQEQALTYRYNDNGQPVEIDRVQDGNVSPQYTFAYDQQGRVAAVTEVAPYGQISYTMVYDQQGNLSCLSVTSPDSRAVYSFYFTRSDGAWVLTGVGNQGDDLTLF